MSYQAQLAGFCSNILVGFAADIDSVTKQRAMVKGIIAKAIQGDARAVERLVDMIERLIDVHDERQVVTPLSEDEKELLDAIGKRFGSQTHERRGET